MSEQVIEISVTPDDTLISLADLKTRLGITGTAQDTILAEQGAVVTDLLRMYTGRYLTQETITATIRGRSLSYAWLPHTPIASLTSVTLDGSTISDCEVNMTSGRLWSASRSLEGDKLVVVYVGGYATIPTPLQDVYARLVKSRIDASGAQAGTGVGMKSLTVFDSHKIDYADSVDSLSGGEDGELAQFAATLKPYISGREFAA